MGRGFAGVIDVSAALHPRQIDHGALAQELLARKPVLREKLAPLGEPNALIVEALRFMSLTAHAERSLTPSPLVDDAWHELILCTREYADLCAEHFGRFIHHDPGGSDELNTRRFRETLRLYGLHFGTPPEAYWGVSPVTADCGACHSP